MSTTDNLIPPDCRKNIAIHELYYRAHWLNAGELLPWIGNAIRGLLLYPLRQKWCLLNPEELRIREANKLGSGNFYCQGCCRNAECSYGRIFEPDRKIIEGRVENGMREGLRAITIAPEYPLPSSAHPDQSWLLRIMAAGELAIGVLPQLINELQELGKTTGIGSIHRNKFSISQQPVTRHYRILRQSDLPTSVCNGVVPLVTLNLATPYLTRNRRDKPSFATLTRESIRTIRRALNEWSSSSSITKSDCNIRDPRISLKHDAWNTAELVHASEQVRIVDDQIYFFQQDRTSARQQARWTTQGWVGKARFRDVPISLIPWVVWGGILGVGESRNTGAGLWSLSLD